VLSNVTAGDGPKKEAHFFFRLLFSLMCLRKHVSVSKKVPQRSKTCLGLGGVTPLLWRRSPSWRLTV